MTYTFWRLSEAGPTNLGLAFTDDGLLLGRTSLIERRDERYVVRERLEIERLFKSAYHGEPPVDRLMAGLARVASALNGNDQFLARIAAVHLEIPDLGSVAAREALAADDSLIKYARDEGGGDATWNPALHPRTGAPPNPGWFAPTDGENSTMRVAASDDPNQGSDAGRPEERPGSKTPKPSPLPPLQAEREMARPPLEGEIIPPSSKREVARTILEAELEAARAANRKAIRLITVLGLRMTAEAAANIIPILDILADVLLAHDAVQLYLAWQKLKIERQAASDFLKKAPYTLEELQVRSPLGYEEFSRYDQFIKSHSKRRICPSASVRRVTATNIITSLLKAEKIGTRFLECSCRTPTTSFACRRCFTKRSRQNIPGRPQMIKQRRYTNGCKVSLTVFSARKASRFFGNCAFSNSFAVRREDP